MSHTSPAGYLVWALFSVLLCLFLLFHLWSFDRFKCVRWNNGPYSGAFKRIMTYSYLLSVPLIMIYACGFAIIKYLEGFTYIPEYGIVPTPYQLWTATERSAILPLVIILALAWGFEMVTHLEELCFWLFLINAGSGQQDWFHSLYFKTWAVGSAIAVVYMPLVTIFTRSDPLKSEAWTFLAGALGSLALTLWFMPVLWAFPAFLKNLQREGVDMSTIVRLTKFHELNTIRIIFRLMFNVPLLILGSDGVRTHHHVNESMFWTDILVMFAGFGVCVSSGITLVIFFPRSIEGEIAARELARERKLSRSRRSKLDYESRTHTHTGASELSISQHHPTSPGGTYLLTSSPVKQRFDFAAPAAYEHEPPSPLTAPSRAASWVDEERDVVEYNMAAPLPRLQPLRPNRRQGGDVELGGMGSSSAAMRSGSLTESNVSRHNMRMSNVNPMVHNFTSPIDFVYTSRNPSFAEMPATNESRFTFTRS